MSLDLASAVTNILLGTGSVVLDGACPDSDGDRHHTRTRGRVSVPGLRAPVSHGDCATSRRTVMNNAG